MLRVHRCYVSRMQRTLRTAHLVVGAVTVGAFLVTGLVMYGHQPPLSGWIGARG